LQPFLNFNSGKFQQEIYVIFNNITNEFAHSASFGKRFFAATQDIVVSGK